MALTATEWLETVKAGLGKYSPAFAAIGADDVEYVAEMDEGTNPPVTKAQADMDKRLQMAPRPRGVHHEDYIKSEVVTNRPAL